MHEFTHGFQIGCVVVPQRGEVVSNLKSADEFAGVIDRKIVKEVALGQMLGLTMFLQPVSSIGFNP